MLKKKDEMEKTGTGYFFLIGSTTEQNIFTPRLESLEPRRPSSNRMQCTLVSRVSNRRIVYRLACPVGLFSTLFKIVLQLSASSGAPRIETGAQLQSPNHGT